MKKIRVNQWLKRAAMLSVTGLLVCGVESLSVSAEEAVAVSEENFPDASFREYVQETCDVDQDGVLSEEEILQVTSINVSYKGTISDLTGIEYFTSLDMLACNGNNLTELDMSKNTNLIQLCCDENALTELDVSQNVALEILNCRNNVLTELDVSKNVNLSILDCCGNDLSELNVSQNVALSGLYCNNNALTALDVRQNVVLSDLDCSNNALTALDVSQCNVLQYLECSDNVHSIEYMGTQTNFDLSTLPGNFDVSKVSEWVTSGVNVNGTILTMDSQKTIIYRYDVGNGNSVEFQLRPSLGSSFIIGITEENFPDVNFRKYVQETCDMNQDGALSGDEISQVVSMNVCVREISNLTGIEYFTSLTKLDCAYNALTELDVSQNVALQLLSCGNNQLTELDVSQNTELNYLNCWYNDLTELDVSQNLALETLYCGENNLTSLDVSQCKILSYLECPDNVYSIEYLGAGTTFDLSTLPGNFDIGKVSEWVTSGIKVEGTILTVDSTEAIIYRYDVGNGNTEEFKLCPSWDNIDISEENFADANFRAYVQANCDINQDRVLSEEEILQVTDIQAAFMGIANLIGVEYFTNLRILVCDHNNLTKLDVSKNTALTHLSCDYNELTELDVSRNDKLNWLKCNNNNLAELDMSQNVALEYLACGYNNLTELDVSKNTALTHLYCQNNKLTELDVSGTEALTDFHCGNNSLTELDVNNNTKLWQLICGNNELAELDVSGNVELHSLYCHNNELIELDVSGNMELSSLYCHNNKLTELDVSQNQNLVKLKCNGNALKKLDVSNILGLYELSCSYNELTKLDVSQNRYLGVLDCRSNELTELDVSQNQDLKNLNCNDNALKRLDVSMISLNCLYCVDNSLTELDLSQSVGLCFLECGGNKLSELDLEQNFGLLELHCENNRLTKLDVSQNAELYSLNCRNNELTELDVSGNLRLDGLKCDGNKLTSLDVSQCKELSHLSCADNIYNLGDLGIGNEFDLSMLPGNFDVQKASAWENAVVKGNMLTVVDPTKDVCFIYDTGVPKEWEIAVKFILRPDETVLITEENFPDENFKTYVEEEIDQDNNSVLTADEIESVEQISVNCMGISNLTGIELFSSLKKLSCSYNNLETLDVSQNKKLTVLDCNSNALETLDVSENINLSSLNSSDNTLIALDVSENTELNKLNCSNATLSALDVSENTELNKLNCANNTLSVLDVNENAKLSSLNCSSNILTTLDVQNNVELYELGCVGNNLETLRVHDDTKVYDDTELTESDLAGYWYDVVFVNGNCELEDLPSSFDVQKVSDWQNATVSGNILKILDSNKKISFSYDVGNGVTKLFAIWPDCRVLRLQGSTRYDTSQKIADALKEQLDVEKFENIIVASGRNGKEADALSGSYLAVVKNAPIILTNDTEEQLTKLVAYIGENLAENGNIYILGGSGTLSNKVEEVLQGYKIQRIQGISRYETSAAIIEEAGITESEIIIATGKTFADTLSASATGRPILLVKPGQKLSDRQKAILEKVKGGKIYIAGGEAAVTAETEAELKAFGTVIRLSGSDRYETSVKIAGEFFEDTDQVVAASGKTAADGLCGGPFAETLNVPLILMKDGVCTVVADYIKEADIGAGYVLGGKAALSEKAVQNVFGMKSLDKN